MFGVKPSFKIFQKRSLIKIKKILKSQGLILIQAVDKKFKFFKTIPLFI